MLRAKAMQLPEAHGARRGTMGSGPPLRVLIIGDSSAAGVGVDTQERALAGAVTRNLARDHTVTWHLHAKTGATTASTLQTVGDIPDQSFDVALQALGVNDMTHGVPLNTWLARQDALVRNLRQTQGVKAFGITGLPPMGQFPLLPNPLRWVLGRQADRLDQGQRARCEADPSLHYITVAVDMDASVMAKDGFHPGPVVYEAWGNAAADTLRAAIASHRSDNPSGG